MNERLKQWITDCASKVIRYAREVIRRLDDRHWENSHIALLFTYDQGIYEVIDLDGQSDILRTHSLDTAIGHVRELATSRAY
jgi:hypothetical protein